MTPIEPHPRNTHRRRHVFVQNCPALNYMSLGDAAVRIIGLHHLIDYYGLDAIVVPHQHRYNPDLQQLWRRAFPRELAESEDNVPETHRDATWTKIQLLDWQFANAAFYVFELVAWENGFFGAQAPVTPRIIFPCSASARAVMIYPAEGTDGNRVYDSTWWLAMVRRLSDKGYQINLLGETDHPPLAQFFREFRDFRHFPRSIQGLADCIAASSLAIGSNTGPTWACLMSDISQIVMESKRSPHGYWHFDRAQRILTKRLTVVPEWCAVI